MNNSSGILFPPRPGYTSPLDLPEVKVTLILCYSIVFACCFFGNILVLFVILRHRKLRSVTNFFLANLAAADLGVGVFCVLPNMSLFLSPTWHLGRVMCKIYYFVQQMCYTASIFILTTIAIERHFAIVHPLKAKRFATLSRLRIYISIIWVLAGLYGMPQLFIYNETTISTLSGDVMCFCVPTVQFNAKAYITVNFFLLYACPIAVIGLLYGRICVVLWRSTKMTFKYDGMKQNGVVSRHNSRSFDRIPNRSTYCSETEILDGNSIEESTDVEKRQSFRWGTRKSVDLRRKSFDAEKRFSTSHTQGKKNSMSARRRVIRLLVLVVVSFSFLVLPYQVRALVQFWSPWPSPPLVEALLPPITFILLFMSSGVNPFLYALLSDTFRQRMAEVLCCKPAARTITTDLTIRRTTTRM